MNSIKSWWQSDPLTGVQESLQHYDGFACILKKQEKSFDDFPDERYLGIRYLQKMFSGFANFSEEYIILMSYKMTYLDACCGNFQVLNSATFDTVSSVNKPGDPREPPGYICQVFVNLQLETG